MTRALRGSAVIACDLRLATCDLREGRPLPGFPGYPSRLESEAEVHAFAARSTETAELMRKAERCP